MKYSALFILLLLCSCSGSDTSEQSGVSVDRDGIAVDADARSIKQEVFVAKENGERGEKLDDFSVQLSRDLELNYTYSYDNKGNRTEEVHYNSQGEVLSRTLYEYDADGKVIKESVTEDMYYRELVPLEASISSDKNGNITEKKIIPKDNSQGYEYCYHHKYTYDDKGNITESWMHEYEADGDYTEKFTYDANNRVTTCTGIGMFGTKTESYEYDENGNLIKLSYRYEEEDPFAEDENAAQTVTTHEYTFQYEYDEKGSWVKRTISENDRAVVVAVRSIEYY